MKLNKEKNKYYAILLTGISIGIIFVFLNYFLIESSDVFGNSMEENQKIEKESSVHLKQVEFDLKEEYNQDRLKLNNQVELTLDVENTINRKYNDEIDEKKIASLLDIARDSYYAGNFDESLQNYQNILKYEQYNLQALKNLYFINKELGFLDQSINYLNKILEIDQDNLYWMFRKAVLLYQHGTYLEAKNILYEVQQRQENKLKEQNDINHNNILSDKEYSILLYYLGQSYIKINDYENVESSFLRGIEIDSNLILNYLGLANFNNINNNYQNAINFYNEALRRDSSLSFIFPKLALLHEKIEDYRLAYTYWNRSISTNNQRNYARQRVNSILEKYPEFRQEEIDRKAETRRNIDWFQLDDHPKGENIIDVRVGLIEDVNSLSLQVGNDFKIYNVNNDIVLEGKSNKEYRIDYKNNVFRIYHEDELIKIISTDKSITIVLNDNRYPFMLYDVSYGEGYFWAGTEDRQYRGVLELYPNSDSDFNAINIVNLEEYIFSVVPAEMPAWWPEEAIKAQTIAARTYAVNNLGKHASSGFDLCDTVHCAVYNGIRSETSRTNKLILETKGEIATYNNQPITAVFSSNSGGYSERSVDIWGGNVSYLDGANNMSIEDFVFPLEPYQLEQWLLAEPDSYSNISPYVGRNIYRWIMVLEADYLKERYNLNEVVDIIATDRTNGGTVNTVILKSEDRTLEFKKDRIRSSLGGLKSNRFFIEKSYDSNNFIEKVIFYGSGWGHHVGMDQTASAGMAVSNYNYDEIIMHFYKGVVIEKLY
ncbi:SpoIID/LytB domain-containing protein [Natronospora cellulosivora (SeqCode)]